MEKHTRNIISLKRALILRNQVRMGRTFHSIRDDITEELRYGGKGGFQISSGKILEDFQEFDELVLLFPADPINGLIGQFVLTLSIQNIDPVTPGVLKIRRAWMVQRGEKFFVMVEIKANTRADERWGYTRHPDVRQFYIAMINDPDIVLEYQLFHQTVFQFQPSTFRQIRIEAGWALAEFLLVPQLIQQSRLIDSGEMLLEALDEKFTIKTGEYLKWLRPLVTLEAIESIASKVENRLLLKGEFLSFNVTVELEGQEITRRKRIQPMIKHPLTLIHEDGTRHPSSIGISVSRRER